MYGSMQATQKLEICASVVQAVQLWIYCRGFWKLRIYEILGNLVHL